MSITRLFLVETRVEIDEDEYAPAVFGYAHYCDGSRRIISERFTHDLAREYRLPIEYVRSINEARNVE